MLMPTTPELSVPDHPRRRGEVLATRALTVLLAALVFVGGPLRAQEPRFFQPSDLHRLVDIGDLAISPDGEWIAYSVRRTLVDEDKRTRDLYMVSWDGETRLQLTHTEGESESSPAFSPDGRYLAFIAARGGEEGDDDDPKGKSQVWLLDRRGGEAFRLTEVPGGVESFVWSPDGKRLVLVSQDPDPDDLDENDDGGGEADNGQKDDSGPETPKPIVVDRYTFKSDGEGYLTRRYTRLHVFDLETKSSFVLTPGDFDSTQPAWSPDGERIAFVSKRPTAEHPDPDRHQDRQIFVMAAEEGAEARRLTSWFGADSSPTWSPDGDRIAYVQGPAEKYDFYGPSQLAVISAQGGAPSLPTEELDRSVSNVRWSLDGENVLFEFEDDRERFIGSVPPDGGEIVRKTVGDAALGKGVISAFEIGRMGTVVLASFPHRPTEIYRLEDGKALSDHNRELREEITWGGVRGFDAVGEDGVRVGSMLTFPPGIDPTAKPATPFPTIAYIHGGPVGQDAFEFDATVQAFAAAGYLVVQPNYRGSSGRGTDFTRAIYGKWGSYEIQDIHTVMDQLQSEGLADPERLGIGGWSYGGINTNYSIASDKRWSAAVSGSGIANLLTGYGTDQYIWQYETEIGKPWIEEDLELYLELSYPFLKADRIETPTLFMCGEKDFNVPLINSEQMYQALKSLGVPTQLVIYPDQYHGLSVPSYIQDRLERMLGWYGQYLVPSSRAAE